MIVMLNGDGDGDLGSVAVHRFAQPSADASSATPQELELFS